MKKIGSAPWVEKYRPHRLNEIIGQDDLIKRLKKFKNDQSMPHFLFPGPAGTGKTTTAIALIKKLQGKNMKHGDTWLELNASDARGINIVRTIIKDFAKTKSKNKVLFKILILDESDDMTSSAQQALRRTMEKYAHNCRFILICNYPNKIILPIQSRCSVYPFSQLSIDHIKNRLMFISLSEGLMIEDEGIHAIAYISDGDCRKSVNYLQSCGTFDGIITKDIVYYITGQIDPKLVKELLDNCLNDNFEYAYDQIMSFINDYGMSAKNIIDQINKVVENSTYDEIIKMKIFRILGEYVRRVKLGSTEDVQLISMICQLTEI